MERATDIGSGSMSTDPVDELEEKELKTMAEVEEALARIQENKKRNEEMKIAEFAARHPFLAAARKWRQGFWGNIAESLTFVAYGACIVPKEMALPIFGMMTTLRRINESGLNGDGKEFASVVYVISMLGLLVLNGFSIFHPGSPQICRILSYIWLATNFLSASYEAGRWKRGKK